MKALAAKCGVSYATIWLLENYQETKVSPEIKQRVAKALVVDAVSLFKTEAMRYNDMLHELVDQMKKGHILKREAHRILKAEGFQPSRHHLLSTLLDFCPGLNFEYEDDAEDILVKMTPDELGDLFHSGLTQEEAIDHLNRAALRLGLKAPELKK